MLQAQFSGRIVKDSTTRTIGKRDYYIIRAVSNNRKDNEGTFVNLYIPKLGEKDLTSLFAKGAVISVSGRLEIGEYNGHPDVTIWSSAAEICKFADNDNDLPSGDAF